MIDMTLAPGVMTSECANTNGNAKPVTTKRSHWYLQFVSMLMNSDDAATHFPIPISVRCLLTSSDFSLYESLKQLP